MLEERIEQISRRMKEKNSLAETMSRTTEDLMTLVSSTRGGSRYSDASVGSLSPARTAWSPATPTTATKAATTEGSGAVAEDKEKGEEETADTHEGKEPGSPFPILQSDGSFYEHEDDSYVQVPAPTAETPVSRLMSLVNTMDSDSDAEDDVISSAHNDDALALSLGRPGPRLTSPTEQGIHGAAGGNAALAASHNATVAAAGNLPASPTPASDEEAPPSPAPAAPRTKTQPPQQQPQPTAAMPMMQSKPAVAPQAPGQPNKPKKPIRASTRPSAAGVSTDATAIETLREDVDLKAKQTQADSLGTNENKGEEDVGTAAEGHGAKFGEEDVNKLYVSQTHP